MTWRDLALGFGAILLALAALALALAFRAVLRARRPGRPPYRSLRLVARGVLIVALAGAGTASLLNAPPPPLVNRPSPVAESATVALLPIANSELGNVVEGASARDGAVRWRWTAPGGGRVRELKAGPPGVAYVSYIPATPPLPGSGGRDSLVALSLADGQPLWSHDGLALETEGRDQLNIGQDGGRVFACLIPQSGSSSVVALDALTGALIWQAALPASARYDIALAATAGAVVVAGSAGGLGDGWHVVALRAADAARAWEVDSAGAFDSGPAQVPSLLATRDTLFVQPQSKPLFALDPQTGGQLWTDTTLAPPDATPPSPIVAVTPDILYEQVAPSGDPSTGKWTLLARDPRTGRTLWSERLDSEGVGFLSAAGALIYAGQSGVRAQDATTRASLWNWRSAPASWPAALAGVAPGVTALAGGGAAVYIEVIEDDTTVLGGFPGVGALCLRPTWVYAVNARTGQPWWRVRLGTTNTCHLVI